MITISDKDRCIYIWGDGIKPDPEVILKYKSKGYTIVKLSNGAGNIRECVKSVAKSSVII